MGVPATGLQRAIRSGRGRPTAFLIVSVMKRVRKTLLGISYCIHWATTAYLINSPKIVTWNLCTLALDADNQITSTMSGTIEP